VTRRSYIGALVCLQRDIRTNGGTTFKKGLRMRCIDSTSGGLVLRCFKREWTEVVTTVSKRDVTIVEWPKDKEED
jgi:hypothetical protein